ncbi:MAG: chaperonin GroEL [Niabella sp.]|nr:MAG: chaperonin GroEL [Niabella sp.]
MAKKIIYNQEARMKLKAGVDAVANAVGSTMGPLGRNVALAKDWGGPTLTHDGVTVAKDIELADPFENMGAKLVIEAASKTNDIVGDGTTSTTILVQALVDEALKNVAAGANPMLMRRGLEKAVDKVIVEIKEISKPIDTKEEKAQVATISAQDEAIGHIVADAMDKVGADGVITVEENKGVEMEVETKTGYNFDNGYLSAYFVTNPDKMEAVVEDPYILLTDKKIDNIQELVPMLESVVKLTQNLVIVADDVSGQALATLVLNKLKGTLRVLAIKAPGFGDRRKAMLEDLAILTGGKVISEDLGRKLDSVTIEDLGRAGKIIATKSDTTVVDGKGSKDELKDRESQLRREIDNSSSEYDREKLQERLAKLVGGVAIIRVGAATETEMKEKKYRVEDAVNATKAAVLEGIVPGGGVALLKVRKVLADLKLDGDEKIGSTILFNALERPFRKILANAGLDAGMFIREVENNLDKNMGINVMQEGKMVDLIQEGIIDPAMVTRSVVEKAVSTAIQIMCTEALVANDPDEKKEESHSHGGMDGMM